MQTNVRKRLQRAAIFAVLGILGLSGWYGFNLYRNAAKVTRQSNPIALVSSLSNTTLKSINGGTNILLAGYSADDSGHNGAELTDSVMIISINQATKAATVISVPRDLYVNIPGYGYAKINEAYVDGENENFAEDGYADGGMGLLEKTIEQTLGVHSNYQALINYEAFKDMVDAAGGVTVTIDSTDPRGLYDPYTNLKLPNGSVTLTGQEALDLARARGDGPGSYGFPEGDFTRTQHQQQILLALKDKITGSQNLSSVSSLMNAVGNNVRTDLGLSELRTLFNFANDLNNTNIKMVTLNDINGEDELTGYTTMTGQSALVPAAGVDDYSDLQAAIDNLLS
jgi:LCP family protein required for cell wall assembly